jgi:hypothetical protein
LTSKNKQLSQETVAANGAGVKKIEENELPGSPKRFSV